MEEVVSSGRYLVSYEIETDARSHREAAEDVWECIRDRAAGSLIFTVQRISSAGLELDPVEVDLEVTR